MLGGPYTCKPWGPREQRLFLAMTEAVTEQLEDAPRPLQGTELSLSRDL